MPATLRSCAASFVRSHARRATSAPPSCPNHVPPCWAACHTSPMTRRGWFGCCCRRTQRSTRSSGKRSNPCDGVHHSAHGSTTTTRHTSHCAASSTVAPGMFYNFGGKLALLSRSTWDTHQFPSRVHDEDGRITLLLLQAQIEERPDLDVATLVRSSTLRNPYTGEPMEYDSRAGTHQRSRCLHTASHPPEPGRPVCRRPRRQGAVMRGRARKQPVQCARFGFAGGFFI